ncbi:MAG: hypothetical protein COA96_02065 [SAR86 cluster bacterium]|uniref:DUF4097 domain-containing protein n=1 Tax=SAR86 cluster bacterium TaxID=2030880 RepID=A0A2A5B9G9_9GAMM|nr:MAG: hypothetical protein COA96_02065 [SAR86 cluster bacterium]
MSHFRTAIARLAIVSLAFTYSSSLQAASDDIEREFDVGTGGTLLIESDAGSIDINTWDQNSVRVRVRNPSGFKVDIDQRGDDVRVKADSRGGFFRIRRSSIRFVVNVPVDYNLELETGGGNIDVSDISGDVSVDTSGGNITIGTVSRGDVHADTSGGHIDIREVDGNVDADTSGGRITIGDVSGYVSADTSGGRITIGDVQGYILADTSGGNIEVGKGGSRVSLNTSGGTIRADWAIGALIADTSGGNIYLEGSDTSIEADTSGGNIVIEASNGPVNADTSGGSITVRGATGVVNADTSGGRIEVDLSAVRGDIGGSVELDTAGGDVTLRIPASLRATINARLNVSRRSRGDYRIYTDFPLTIREDNDEIVASGDLNGGGDRITLRTRNSDIHIVSVDN